MANKEQAITAPQSVSFLAIDPYRERLIERPTEKVQTGKDWIRWGDKNTYPYYLESLSAECTTLRTIQLGLVDYIVGNGVQISGGGLDADAIDAKHLTPAELVEASAKDAARLGGFAWELIPNAQGNLAAVSPLRFKYIRLNKEGDVVYYSEKWNKNYSEMLVYPRWSGVFPRDEKTGDYSPAVLYVKCWGDGVYPEPLYASAVKECETERGIAEFHLGNIERGFMGSYMINFCNGAPPTDEAKRQIERDVQSKFGGASNAGRIMLNFADNKEHLAVLQKMEVADYGEKYATLSEFIRQQLYTCFRANPNLFGIPTAQGFNSEEYEAAFKLFNRTIVHPLQVKICAAWNKATGGTMTIEPFTLDGAEQAAGNNANGVEE